MAAKGTYNRRSDEQRIADLEAKIANLQKKMESRQRPDIAVLKQAPKLQRRLRDFAQLAAEHERSDIANSAVAFLAGLERMLDTPPETQRRRRRTSDGQAAPDEFA